jgi:DNA-directed RNA polymerase subunit RPC12/RpoP
MAKKKDNRPLLIRCPNCKQMKEPDFNETTHRYVCPVCSTTVDAQVFIEKKKRKSGSDYRDYTKSEF